MDLQDHFDARKGKIYEPDGACSKGYQVYFGYGREKIDELREWFVDLALAHPKTALAATATRYAIALDLALKQQHGSRFIEVASMGEPKRNEDGTLEIEQAQLTLENIGILFEANLPA